jgi:TolB-like protein
MEEKMIKCGVLFLAVALSAGAVDSTGKITISVYGLKAISVSDNLAESLQEHVESNLINYGLFDVMSRSDMDMILKENRFQQSGACSDEECVVEAGHILGVQKIVTGTVSRVGHTYNVVLKMVDVESGRLESAANRKHTGSIDNLLDIAEEMVGELIGPKKNEENESDSATAPAPVLPTELHAEDTSAKKAESMDITVAADKKPAKAGQEPSPKAKWLGIGALALLGSVAAIVLISNLVD